MPLAPGTSPKPTILPPRVVVVLTQASMAKLCGPGSLPDVITLYRIPILTVCRTVDEVGPRVLKVLGHEVGHALGLSESQLRAYGWY